ncbi:MAG: hypothetical protein QOI10_696 [Solirubrobacterales bacterium]|jgi:hypothetical protein|nr:hypothetical protein [Solirubrobacterales bacterium]
MAAAGALALGLTAIAAAAPGDVVFTGSTTEGAKVKLTVASAGNATAFKIGKTKVTCVEGGTLNNNAGTYTDFDTSDPGAFSDKDSTSSDSGGYHFETKSNISGAINADQTTWSGAFKLTTKVLKHGQKIDTCKLKTSWNAA